MGASSEIKCVGCIVVSWISLLAFFLEEAFINLRRHGVATFATVTTVALTVGLWGFFELARLGAESWMLWEGQKLERLCVFLKPDVKEEKALKVVGEVKKLPEVTDVRFVHKEEGLQKLQRLFGNTMPLKDLVGRNPLPHAIEVTCHSPKVTVQCAAQLQKLPEVDEVAFPAAAVERFVRFLDGVQLGATALSLALAIAAFALIYNAIRLSVYGRRNEIRIMQLVGATVWTVRGPLLMEGLLYGLLGGLMTLIMIATALKLGISALEAGYLRSVLETVRIDSTFVLQVLVLGTGLGFLSAFFAAVRLVKAE